MLDLGYSDYNPFCSNLRDPGATGKGQCDGVRDLNNPLNAAAGLKTQYHTGSVVFFSFTVALSVIKDLKQLVQLFLFLYVEAFIAFSNKFCFVTFSMSKDSLYV